MSEKRTRVAVVGVGEFGRNHARVWSKMDGVELAHIAHRQSPKMRVVVISGQAPASALPEGVRFLAKPFYPITLLREAAR